MASRLQRKAAKASSDLDDKVKKKEKKDGFKKEGELFLEADKREGRAGGSERSSLICGNKLL